MLVVAFLVYIYDKACLNRNFGKGEEESQDEVEDIEPAPLRESMVETQVWPRSSGSNCRQNSVSSILVET